MIVIFLLGLNSLITISLSPPPSHPQNTCHTPGRETPAHRPPLSRVLRGGARGTHLWDPDPGPSPTTQSHPTMAAQLTSPHRTQMGPKAAWGGGGSPDKYSGQASPLWALVSPRVQ